MDAFQKGWFTEVNDLWPGLGTSLQVEKVLHTEKTPYQEMLVFQSKHFGRVLVLDGIIQYTETDEFIYHELIAQLPLHTHPNPKSVLVVGGGDGGVLREVGRHSGVEEIHICEIDERVIAVSKEFLPQTSVGFSDPRVQVHIEDGMKFMEEHKNRFDIIVTDSCDPVGPAEALFGRPYYEKVKAALKPGGVISCLSENLQTNMDIVQKMMAELRSVFPVVGYASGATFHDQIGFVIASTDPDAVLGEPVRKLSESEVKGMGLRYYNSDVHRAAFVLPQFAKEALS